MDKLSNAQAAEVLADAASTLRAQSAHINSLEEKLASRDRRDRVEKLAGMMHSKGLELDTSVDALADRLEKAAAAGKLEAVEHAVDLVGPDMGTKLAQLTNDEPGVSSASSALEQFIVGGVG
jgi:type II secretory pathway component PulF